MPTSGWKKEPLTFTDYSHEKLFGAASPDVKITPYTRDISGLPIVYQGKDWDCVAATVTFIKQYQDKKNGRKISPLSHKFLAAVSNTGADGATPSQVLMAAKNVGICESEKWVKANGKISAELELNAKLHGIGGFAFLHRLDPASLFHAAVTSGPLMLGVDSYQGSEPHMMAEIGVEERNGIMGFKTANWWKENEQDEGWVPFSDVKFAATVLDKKPVGDVAMPIFAVLQSKWQFVSNVKKAASAAVSVIVALSGLISGAANQSNGQVPNGALTEYGSAGIYDVYSPTVAGSGVDNDDNFLPVSTLSLTDGSGISITTSTIHFPVYLTVNPKESENREVFECNSLSTANNRFTNCNRAISCNNLNNTTSTISGGAYAHSAGQAVILSNNACFFNRFVDNFTTQNNIAGIKTFTATSVHIGDNTTSTGKQILFQVGQTNEPYFKIVGPTPGNSTSSFYFSVDGVSDLQLNASGTTFGVSTTNALVLANGLAGVNASGTNGLRFLSDGSLGVSTSPTASNNGGFLLFSTSTGQTGKLFWDVLSFLRGAWTWTNNQIFSGTTTFTNDHLISGNATTTGNFTVNSPTSTRDAANKFYVDNALFGDGSDGAFSQSSGMTTLNTSGKNVYQYTSFALTGTASLTAGANLINKPLYILVQGDLTITSTSGSAVFRTGQGGPGGTGGSGGDNATAGTSGGTSFIDNGGARGTQADSGNGGGGGGGYGNAATAGSNGGGAGGAAGAYTHYTTLQSINRQINTAFLGGGGGGGGRDSSTGNAGGNGGNGGGSVIFIVGGNINLTGIFAASGTAGVAGTSGSNSGGGGGGGGGGFIGVYYAGSVTANTALFNVGAGSGGTSGDGGAGGAGAAGQSEVRQIKTRFAL